mgnify:CR=1 FL=1
MSLIQTAVGAPAVSSFADGSQPNLLGGKQGEAVVSELHGKFYTQAVRGNLFVGTQAAAGAVIPIYSNTTQQCGLLNPSGSGVNVVPVRLNIGYVSTTAAAGSFAIGYITAGGGLIATGGKGVTAATTATGINANLLGPNSKAIFMSAAITTVAPGLLMQIGVNQLVTTAADATNVYFDGKYAFDGTLIVPQGCGIFVAGNIALLQTVTCSVVWEEVPA